jgi:type IV secretory pathway VirB2 component (pilin)
MPWIDPLRTSAVGSAVEWVQVALLGSIGTSVAIIAIASVGFLMITGRIELRRAVQVVLGCFIIFGSSTVASGILSTLSGGGGSPDLAQPAPAPLPSPPAVTHAPATPYDPYAGAALPPR